MTPTIYSFDEAMAMIQRGISGFKFRNAQGHKSFVSKNTHEDGFVIERVFDDTFDFGAAIVALKAGKRVSRAGWNGKNMFLFLVQKSENLEVNREPLMSILGKGSRFNYQAHVDMFTADGTIVPWLCSQTDMLAEDWGIVPDAED